MNDEVLEFIMRRFPVDCYWLNGNCYYFALILHERFPQSEILYDTIEGHFVIRYKNTFYDWHGIYIPEDYSALVKWENYKNIDASHYERIIRDTIY